MKKCIIFVIALFYSCLTANTLFAADGLWTLKSDIRGYARCNAVGFSIGNKGYVGTGLSGISFFNDFWEYDPNSDTWTQKANFKGDVRSNAAGFSIGSKGYIGTGMNGFDVYNDFWEYDPAANTWTRKADFGGTVRFGAVAFSIGNKGYIGTGAGIYGLTLFRDFWEYDPVADTWTRKADFWGAPRFGAVAFSIGSNGYIGTGMGMVGSPLFKDFWKYNPAGDTWTRKADFRGAARNSAVGFSIGDKGYLGTGFKYLSVYNDFWQYDPAADTWTQKTDFGGGALYGAVGFSIGSKGYIGTGESGPNCVKTFWEFDPALASYANYFDAVQKVYIGYYRRPADPAGLVYWADQVDRADGDLTEIIEAFADSEEAKALYGTINSSNIATVVNEIYKVLFGRDAEMDDRNYWIDGFNSGQFTPATIMLNILDGAQNEDLQSINHKLAASNIFTSIIDPELDGADSRATYAGYDDATAGRIFLSSVTWDPLTVPTQDETTTYIQNNIADPDDPLYPDGGDI